MIIIIKYNKIPKTPNDIYKLKELGIQNAIFGKAFYEGNISFDDVKNYIKN